MLVPMAMRQETDDYSDLLYKADELKEKIRRLNDYGKIELPAFDALIDQIARCQKHGIALEIFDMIDCYMSFGKFRSPKHLEETLDIYNYCCALIPTGQFDPE